jgi:hypothetical protein
LGYQSRPFKTPSFSETVRELNTENRIYLVLAEGKVMTNGEGAGLGRWCLRLGGGAEEEAGAGDAEEEAEANGGGRKEDFSAALLTMKL